MTDAGTPHPRIHVGPSVLVPNMLSSCVLWLDASKLSSIAKDGSNRVATWGDLSGQGNDVAQATDGNKPVWTSGAINGLPALLFDDAASQVLESSTPAVSTAPFTVLCAAQPDTTSGSLIAFAISDKDSQTDRFRLYFSNGSNVIWQGLDPTPGTGGESSSDSGYSANTTYVCTGREVSSTSRFVYLNGTAGSENTDDRTPANVDVTTVGARRSSSSSWVGFFSGYIAEIAVFNEALSTLNRTRLEQYMADKWGVTLA